MKRAKKLLSLLIAAILLVSLSSCGGSKGGGENEAALGKYNALTYSFGDMTLDATGDWLELKSKGKATISVDGDEFACKWKLNGTDFTLEERGDIFKGTLENGVIELNLEGIVYTFAKPGFEPATSPESEEAPVVTAAQDLADSEYADEIAYWNGDWYGWWWITSAAGDWAHLSEKYYDMYCTINLDADGMGQMMFWDDDAGLMKLEVKLDTNNSAPHGILVSTKGYLWDFDYKPGEWVIDVEDMTVTQHEDFDPKEGVTVVDKAGNTINDRLQVIYNDVDMSRVGTYEVVYEASDEEGRSTIQSISVKVLRNTGYQPGTTDPTPDDPEDEGFSPLGTVLIAVASVVVLGGAAVTFFMIKRKA